MNTKLNWFYRISIWIVSILFLLIIYVKALIWFMAAKEFRQGYQDVITLNEVIAPGEYRYTSKANQNLFQEVDYLFTPAFTILFIVITAKLVKTPDIFEEE